MWVPTNDDDDNDFDKDDVEGADSKDDDGDTVEPNNSDRTYNDKSSMCTQGQLKTGQEFALSFQEMFT